MKSYRLMLQYVIASRMMNMFALQSLKYNYKVVRYTYNVAHVK